MSRKYFKIIFIRYMKRAGLNGYDYDFSVYYYAIAVDDIDIQKHLMKKNNIIY